MVAIADKGGWVTGKQPTLSNTRAFQHPGSNPDDPTAGTGDPTGRTRLVDVQPAPVAGPKPLTDYAKQYEASLVASRAGIEHQLGAALADINAKEARAREATGLLPGQLKGIYDTGNAGLAASAHSLDTAQQASGLQSFMGADAQLAPLHAAIAGDSAARQADVPLLNIGLAQAAAAEHANLQQQRLAAYGDLEAQQRQYLAGQMADQRQAAATQAQMAFQQQQQQTGADLSLRNTLAATQLRQAASAGANYGLLVTPAAGAQMEQTDPHHASSLRSSPAYGDVVMTLKQLGGARVNAMLKDPTWLQGFMSGNSAYGGTGTSLSPQAVSLALYDAGYKP